MCYSINCGQRRSLLPRSVGDAFFTASEISWTSFSQCGERERLWERGCNIPFFRTRNVRILQRVIISPEKYLTCKKTCYENSCVAQLCQRLFLIFAGGGWGSCNWSHIASKGMTVRVPSAPVLKALGFLFYDWPTSKSLLHFIVARFRRFFNVSSSILPFSSKFHRNIPMQLRMISDEDLPSWLKKEIGASIRRMKNRRNTLFASIPSWLIIMFAKSQLQRKLLASHWRQPFFSLNRIPMRAVTDWIFYYAIVFQLE